MADLIEDRASLREAAKAIGVSHTGLQKVLDGTNGVTAQMALRFAAYVGNERSARLWLDMQRDYDLWIHGDKLRAELKAIKPLKG
jgi:addiction module HigA family antidote